MKQTVRFVYKLYDAESRVMYVGLSQDPYKRIRMHAHHFPYWSEVRTIEVYAYPWDVAPMAEHWFIKVDSPLHNGSRPGASYKIEHPGETLREFLFEATDQEVKDRPVRWFYQLMRDVGLDEIHGSYLSRWAPAWASEET